MRIVALAFLLTIAGCSVFQGSSKPIVEQQYRTVDAIRDIGTALEAYKLTNGKYPTSSTGHLEEIESLLVPELLKKLPKKDGWGNEIEYYCLNPEGPYYIVSLGSDKERDVGLYKSDRSPSGLGFKVISDFKEDIIFSNGLFVRYPQGIRVASS